MVMPALNLVQYDTFGALSGRLSGASMLGGPITTRDTLRTTHGQEAFVSAAGQELFPHITAPQETTLPTDVGVSVTVTWAVG